MTTEELEFGDKVTFIKDNKHQHGMVKGTIDRDIHNVFVVYWCADDWDNFDDYTAQLTQIEYLHKGWI